jgi:anaerobic selenocysteine-containing dehydrogenase
MSKQISRRDFLKLAGVGAATSAVLTGCGPASRYVTREPYAKMPEYNYNGLSTYYATTCRECSAGCGLVVRTMQGRALKVEGNANNPVNLGKTCARGQATLHGMYNPDRVTDPIHRSARSGNGDKMDWDAATQVVVDALSKNKPEEIAFLMGMAPDHLFDLVTDLTKALGAPAPIRFGALSMFEARATLTKAAHDIFGEDGLPFFDIAGSDLVLSFGANFLETWLSPVAQTRGFSKMRRNKTRGSLVQFEARMSQTGAKADEWVAIKPGSEAMIALAIGRLVAEARSISMPAAYANVNVTDIASNSGVKLETLQKVADMFVHANAPLAIPGGPALGQSNGLQAAEAILALNALAGSAGNFGKDGGVFLSPHSPFGDDYHRPASAKEMQDFIQTLSSGKIKVLFVHGVNPLFELPRNFGMADALKSVDQVISFATFPDETAAAADYVFPDHQGLESWGYQRVATGASSSVLSGAQPVVSPFYNTKATADVLLAATQKIGGALASALNFKDEVEYIDSKLSSLIGAQGFFSAPDIDTFAAYFQQYGGWWKTGDDRIAPASSDVLNRSFSADAPQFDGKGDFFFVPFVSPTLGEAGANKPWLQELPDPNTTVMWNAWVEMNPATAEKLGIKDDDVIIISSDYGSIEAAVYKYPAIHPDTIAMPFGQGHTAYGRYAQGTSADPANAFITNLFGQGNIPNPGHGPNPADLFGKTLNEAGDVAFAGLMVRIERTGKKRSLARLESMLGVYGATE